MNMPLLMGAILGGAVVIDYGVKNTRQAFASSSTGSSSSTPTTQASPAAGTSPAAAGGAPSAGQVNQATGAGGAGFHAQPGTNFSVGQEPQIVTDLDELSAYLGEPIYGISGYRTPAHSAAVGGFTDDPHTRGQAADIGVGAPTRASAASVSEKVLAMFGLWRPFDPTDDPNNSEVNHVELIGVS